MQPLKAVKRKFPITGLYHFYLFPASFLKARCVIIDEDLADSSVLTLLKELLNSTAVKRAGMNGVSVKAYPQKAFLYP